MQFSPRVEKLLAEVHPPSDEFEEPNFNPIDYINSKVADSHSSLEVDRLLKETGELLLTKEATLISAINSDAADVSKSGALLSSTKASVNVLQTHVNKIKERAALGVETMQRLSGHIRELDTAKTQLSVSINTLRSMAMWLLQLHILSSSFHQKKYIQSLDALLAAKRCQAHFSKMEEVPRIKELNQIQSKQCNEMEYYIRNSLIGELNWDAVNEKELADVCALVNAMSLENRNKVRDKFIEKALESYMTRFKRGTEDAKLERTERRYVYIRSLLEHFDSLFNNVFPPSWCVPQELSVSFCIRTKQELDYQLQEYAGKMDVVVLTYVLQKTIDIERDLTQLMAWKKDFPGRDELPVYKYNGFILSAFKEYMHLFVQSEDKLMGDALNAHSLTGEGEHTIAGWESDTVETDCCGMMLPLAEDIFVFISQSLKRSLRISQQDVLLDMSSIWRKYLIKMSGDISLILPFPAVTLVEVRRACYITNTARFCQSTSQDLGREIAARSEASSKDVAFDSVSDCFADLYSKSVNSLVQGLGVVLAPSLQVYGSGSFMDGRDPNEGWMQAHKESQTARSIISLIHSFFLQCAAVLPSHTLRFLVEKMTAVVIPTIVGCLYSMKKMTDDGVNVMRVDAAILEKAFLQLPNHNNPTRFQSTALTSFTKLVRREFGHLHRALKVIQVSTTQETLVEMYYEVMDPDDRSIQNFVRLAELRGFRVESLRQCITKLSSLGVVEATKRDLEREAARGLTTGLNNPNPSPPPSQSSYGYSLFKMS